MSNLIELVHAWTTDPRGYGGRPQAQQALKAEIGATLIAGQFDELASLWRVAQTKGSARDLQVLATLIWQGVGDEGLEKEVAILPGLITAMAAEDVISYRQELARNLLQSPVLDASRRAHRKACLDALIGTLPETVCGEPKANWLLKTAMACGRAGWIWADWAPAYQPEHDQETLEVGARWVSGRASTTTLARWWVLNEGATDDAQLPVVGAADLAAICSPRHLAHAVVTLWGDTDGMGAEQLWAQSPMALPDLALWTPVLHTKVDALTQHPTAPDALRTACLEALWAHYGAAVTAHAPQSRSARLALGRQQALRQRPVESLGVPRRRV